MHLNTTHSVKTRYSLRKLHRTAFLQCETPSFGTGRNDWREIMGVIYRAWTSAIFTLWESKCPGTLTVWPNTRTYLWNVCGATDHGLRTEHCSNVNKVVFNCLRWTEIWRHTLFGVECCVSEREEEFTQQGRNINFAFRGGTRPTCKGACGTRSFWRATVGK